MLKRAFASIAGRRRYACLACRHRGWTTAHFPHLPGAEATPGPVSPGRPLERRDFRAARELRLRTFGLALAAALVGAVLAAWLAG